MFINLQNGTMYFASNINMIIRKKARIIVLNELFEYEDYIFSYILFIKNDCEYIMSMYTDILIENILLPAERIFVPVKTIIDLFYQNHHRMHNSIGRFVLPDTIELFNSEKFMSMVRAHLIMTRYIVRRRLLPMRRRQCAAANAIKIAFKRAISNPNYALCRRRLLRECAELHI